MLSFRYYIWNSTKRWKQMWNGCTSQSLMTEMLPYISSTQNKSLKKIYWGPFAIWFFIQIGPWKMWPILPLLNLYSEHVALALKPFTYWPCYILKNPFHLCDSVFIQFWMTQTLLECVCTEVLKKMNSPCEAR